MSSTNDTKLRHRNTIQEVQVQVQDGKIRHEDPSYPTHIPHYHWTTNLPYHHPIHHHLEMNRMLSTPLVISSRSGGRAAAAAASLSSLLTTSCGGGGGSSTGTGAAAHTSWSSSSTTTTSSSFFSSLPHQHHRYVSSSTPTSSSAAVPATLSDDDDVNKNNDITNRFSIRGTFREGRASYLDASATTPLDPRVLDKMMPYMVSYRDGMMCVHISFSAQLWGGGLVAHYLLPLSSDTIHISITITNSILLHV